MKVVNPTDLPNSARNRCVIEVLVTCLCCRFDFFLFFVGAEDFFIGLRQASSLFSSILVMN